MEFERAIFRVYERCIDGLRDEDNDGINSKSCKAFESMSLSAAFFFLATLIVLHFNFVGRPGCLPDILHQRAVSLNLSSSSLGHDQILQVRVDRRYAPNVDHSGSDSLTSSSSTDDGFLGDGRVRKRMLRSSSLNEDKVNIDVDGSTSSYSDKGAMNIMSMLNKAAVRAPRLLLDAMSVSMSVLPPHSLHPWRELATSNNSSPNATSTPSTAPSTRFYKRSYDFEFAYQVGILALPDEIIAAHNFDIVNITMTGQDCFGGSILQELLPIGGIDTVVMNAIMFTTKKGGTMMSSAGDYYSWTADDIHPYSNPLDWFAFKLNVLLSSLFAFFFLTSITALLVRILLSSGVVLLFPIFWALQYFGVQIISSRVISLSYPWIGIPMEMYRANQQSSVPFIISHITR